VLHQEGFDPVVKTPLADPITIRWGIGWHLEALAERLVKALQGGPGQRTDGAVELVDRGGIQRCQAWIVRLSITGFNHPTPLWLTGLLVAMPRPWAGALLYALLVPQQLVLALRTYQNNGAALQRQEREISQRFLQLRQAVRQAGGHADLQQRLKRDLEVILRQNEQRLRQQLRRRARRQRSSAFTAPAGQPFNPRLRPGFRGPGAAPRQTHLAAGQLAVHRPVAAPAGA
jgi:hypothetical protein